jgi:hypothetical protein
MTQPERSDAPWIVAAFVFVAIVLADTVLTIVASLRCHWLRSGRR